jgi:hypothetical protein
MSQAVSTLDSPRAPQPARCCASRRPLAGLFKRGGLPLHLPLPPTPAPRPRPPSTRRFGNGLAWYVPLGLASWFKARGITNVTELGWWEERQHPGSKVGAGRAARPRGARGQARTGGRADTGLRAGAHYRVPPATRPARPPARTQVRLVLTPAQHWSARGPLDRRRTLWGGWAVVGRRARAWFAGDTGYGPFFPEIHQRLGPFDLAFIPTGAYEPRDFMGPQVWGRGWGPRGAGRAAWRGAARRVGPWMQRAGGVALAVPGSAVRLRRHGGGRRVQLPAPLPR